MILVIGTNALVGTDFTSQSNIFNVAMIQVKCGLVIIGALDTTKGYKDPQPNSRNWRSV